MGVVSGEVVPIGVRIGYAKAPDAKVVLMSLSNAAATVECNGASYNVTWNAADAVGYYAHVTLSGLSEFTEYGYTVTQGASSVSGSFRTLPGTRDDFSFYFITCDANWRPGAPGGATPPTGHGFYKNIREQIASGEYPPCAGVFHVDDHGYNANRYTYEGGAVRGPAQTSLLLRDYVAAWFGYYGLLPDIDHGYAAGIPTSTQEGKINNAIGTNPDRVWCMQNLPVWPQWGDWEFSNDLGWDAPTSNSPTANGYHATYSAGVGQKDGGGYLAWSYFMAHLQPPTARSADTGANHWAFTCGAVDLIAPDGVTNATGGYANEASAITAIYGSNQINDVLNAANTSTPFKVFGLMYSHQYLHASGNTEYQSGVQHPLKNHCAAEFAQMFTSSGATPKSICDNPNTNGLNGVSVMLHGDYHSPYVYSHAITGGGVTARYYDIGAATCHGSTNFFPSNEGDVVPGYSYNGTEVVYSYVDAAGTARNNGEFGDVGGPSNYRHYFGARVDVYGSRSRPEMHVTLYGWDDEVLWQGRFVASSSNEAFTQEFGIPASCSKRSAKR